MSVLKNILPIRFFELLEKAGICTPKQIITLSVWDIQKLTNLLYDDVMFVKNIVAQNYSPMCVNGNKLQEYDTRISTGCSAIDTLLNGGFRKGTITEIYGESGSGKTQIAMQTAANCGKDGCVYVCTEDLFPVKRFNEISRTIWNENAENTRNAFIEHLSEATEVLSCIRVRLPKLLSSRKISTVIIDSVAAPFRCEYTNYMQRAEDLKELAFLLIKLAQEYNLAVICINQVAACLDTGDILPTLGLVWSNMVSYRLKLTKTSTSLRELTIAFSPDLPSGKNAAFTLTQNGIEDVKHKQ